jgi:DNA topoisomerase-1
MNETVKSIDVVAAELMPAGLVYTSDIVDGITRKPGRNGFLYYTPDRRRIIDKDEVARLNALAIPPAYTDVHISTNALSHLQAVGTDARGRRQYRYHPEWHAERARAKFERLVHFGSCLPDIRARVDADLRAPRLTMEKALAAVVWLLDNLYIRIGNATYAESNGSYGLTTLRNRHVTIQGSSVKFRFKGKSGKQWNLVHTDRRIANVVRRLQELPGQQLFKCMSDDGTFRQISSQDVNAYIRDAAGEEFSSRQFRTWGATCAAIAALAPLEVATSERAISRQLNEVIDTVALKLVNTRAVCRSSYIHPAVFEDFKAGRLGQILETRMTRSKRLLSWMDEEEIRVLHWLRSAE